MFGRSKESAPVTSKPMRFDTLLGPEMKLTGTIKGKGALRIEGQVEGEIEYDGDLVVGEKAVVRASIKANSVTIAGMVEGDVVVNGRLELVSTGKLIGDMSAQTFVVAEGALFRGRSDMGEETEAATKKSPARQTPA